MIAWTDQGLVLSSKNHAEKYRLVNIFTNLHGKITALVSSTAIHSKFSILSSVEVDYSARNEISLGFWKLKKEKQSWMRSMHFKTHIFACQSMCFLLNRALSPAVPYNNLFNFVHDIIDNLAKFSNSEILRIYSYFEFALLHTIGFGIDLSSYVSVAYDSENHWLFETPIPKTNTGNGSFIDQIRHIDVVTSLKMTGTVLENAISLTKNHFRMYLCDMVAAETVNHQDSRKKIA
jgi:hypothetical protein